MASKSGGGFDFPGMRKTVLDLREHPNKNDVVELTKHIKKSEIVFMNPDPDDEPFLTSFTVLAADGFSTAISTGAVSQTNYVFRSTLVLIQYLVQYLRKQIDNPSVTLTLPSKRVLQTIRTMCTLEFPANCAEESEGITAILSSSKVPEATVKHLTVPDSNSGGFALTRLDKSRLILEQLTTPQFDTMEDRIESPSADTKTSPGGSAGGLADAPPPDTTANLQAFYTDRNIWILRSLGAGEVLIDVCMALPHINRYVLKAKESLSRNTILLPFLPNETLLIRQSLSLLENDLNVLHSTLQLPLLEPLTPDKLEKLTILTMASLYIAVSVATAATIHGIMMSSVPKQSGTGTQRPNDDEIATDKHAVAIVERALDFFNYVSSLMKNSSKAGGNIPSNHAMIGIMVLLTGLHHQLHVSNNFPLPKEERGKSPRKAAEKMNLTKLQQGFNVLSVAVTSSLLKFMKSLMSDMMTECLSLEDDTGSDQQPANLNIMGNYTALQRVLRLLCGVPVAQLLLNLATVSYRKACALKRVTSVANQEEFVPVDASTDYDDDFSAESGEQPQADRSNEESSQRDETNREDTQHDNRRGEEDEDSEPILGLWLEETLAPESSVAALSESSREKQDGPGATGTGGTGGPCHTHIPSKGPDAFLSLGLQIIRFLNKYMVNVETPRPLVPSIQEGIGEQQLASICGIIRDLDRESSKSSTQEDSATETIYSNLEVLYNRFSGAFSQFTHNMVMSRILTDTMQKQFLNLLVKDHSNPSMWPLLLHCRSLAVVAQMIMLKPLQERTNAVLNVWKRLINTIVESVTRPIGVYEPDSEDLNIEHAYVLLYLFHSLNLIPRKSVMLMTASAAIRCADAVKQQMSDLQILYLSRLILLFEYQLKYLYEAPQSLLERVDWILFRAPAVVYDNSRNKSEHAFIAAEVEATFQRLANQQDSQFRPRFYFLTMPEGSNQDVPKLDGLACNFIVGSPGKWSYDSLLNSVIEILNVADQLCPAMKREKEMSVIGHCSVRYCFTVCWRIVQMLPPSIQFMERLTRAQDKCCASHGLHHTLWAPRLSARNFNTWILEYLLKQTANGQILEDVIQNVNVNMTTTKLDISLVKEFIARFTPKVTNAKQLVPKSSMPKLTDVFLLDVLMTRLHVTVEDGFLENEDSDSDTQGPESVAVATAAALYTEELLPHIFKLLDCVLACMRSGILYQIEHMMSSVTDRFYLQDLSTIGEMLFISTNRNVKTFAISATLLGLLPHTVISFLDKWGQDIVKYDWVKYRGDIIPSESFMMEILGNHVTALSCELSSSLNMSLKYLTNSLVTFITKHIQRCPYKGDLQRQGAKILMPLTLDIRTEYVVREVLPILEDIDGPSDNEQFLVHCYTIVLEHCENLMKLVDRRIKNGEQILPADEVALIECLKFIEVLLEKPYGIRTLNKFFFEESSKHPFLDLFQFVPTSQGTLSTTYIMFSLRMLQKMCAGESPAHTTLYSSVKGVIGTFSEITKVNSAVLHGWLMHLLTGPSSDEIADLAMQPVVIMPSVQPSSTQATQPSTNYAPADWKTLSPIGDSLSAGQSSTPQNKSSTDAAPPDPDVPATTEEQRNLVKENYTLLQSLCAYFVKEDSGISEEVAITLLKALIKVTSTFLTSPYDGQGFADLMVTMRTLAESGTGNGFILLFKAATDWLDICKSYLNLWEIQQVLEKEQSPLKHKGMCEAACGIMNFMSCVFEAISPPSLGLQNQTPWDDDMTSDRESDLIEDMEPEDDESEEDDSDEDSLCNRLCTFTITQREFMNQHWYHCHTCKMVDGVGVCSVCARVCHKGHDVTYAKYGNFFCDCGAQEDNSCIALSKRSRLASEDAHTQNMPSADQPLSSTPMQQRNVSPVHVESGTEGTANAEAAKQSHHTSKIIANHREEILRELNDNRVMSCLMDLLIGFVPAMQCACRTSKVVGSYKRARDSLFTLHLTPKKFELTEMLMVPTLGSQEGAFENVRMTYSGEQGQTIRQLLSAQMIRRVAMCCMSSPHGKRHHLAVSHEKGKITVLQLSALLKQPEASKRKLTLTRLSSAPVPFTVLSITGNPCNEDFLAVCGLKDCHVLTFSSSGTVVDHLVLHPQLETGNFIIRAIWLPGSQTKLALVTADFVKIYDLSKDALSPQYFFLIPAGKVRDCTFVSSQYLERNPDGCDHMLLMCSNGHIYDQVMNEESSALNGPFYVTNTLTLCHPEIGEVVGQIASQGGVSVYYSHSLQMLFWSYVNGKSFMAPLRCLADCVTAVFPIQFGKQTTNGNKANNSQPQPLCQWTEVPNHPGLVCSLMQGSNNPVILMLKPDVFLVQEIKVVPSKAKIMDMVVVRHPSSSCEYRTTLILLCEDGSLRIYMAGLESTGYWLLPSIKNIAKTHKVPKKKKPYKLGKTTGTVVFPVDFFEHCEPINSVEFGGNDLLQIYSAHQIKHRLNTTGLYVASSKASGFSIEVTNPDPATMIMGIRVLLGTQDVQKAPTYIEVFGRTVQTNLTRSRWFDVPFTREESLQADKKFTITFGPSADVEHISMVDCIKIYGKLKDIYNWSDDTEELVTSATAHPQAAAATDGDDSGIDVPQNLSCLEKVLSSILSVIDNFFGVNLPTTDDLQVFKSHAKDLVTLLLYIPVPSCVETAAESLLSTLHPTRTAYFNYKDHVLLGHVNTEFALMRDQQDPKTIDAEAFYQLVMTIRSIAVARPHNLAKFEKIVNEEHPPSCPSEAAERAKHFIVRVVETLWRIHSARPVNMTLAPVYIIGLTQIEATVQAVVEIIHAFTISDPENTLPTAAALYLQLLLCEDVLVSFSAKQALLRVLRPRVQRQRGAVATPPVCSTPGGLTVTEVTYEKSPGSVQSQERTQQEQAEAIEPPEPTVSLAPEPTGYSASSSSISDGSVETLLNAAGNFPALMDIPPDTDDETLVELAIALSLQGMDPSLAQGTHQEAGHYSDTTASAGGSDDEGSTAATDGSTLRTSPTEQMQDADEPEQKVEQEHDEDTDAEEETSSPRIHFLRLALLEHFIGAVSKLKNLGGVKSVPFLQVVLMLTSDLYGNEERSQDCLKQLLSALLNELNLKQPDTSNVSERNKNREVCLVIMRLLSVMLSRTKSTSKVTTENTSFVSSVTSTTLRESDLINYCLALLKSLLNYWKSSSPEEGTSIVGGTLLKARPTIPPPDMAPFFLRQYVKSHAADVFEAYPQLLTEMVLRLPYQIHKSSLNQAKTILVDEASEQQEWRYYLCEYMMTQQTPFVRRQVRKLLLSICGTKEEYRQLRDLHSLNSHFNWIQQVCSSHGLDPQSPYPRCNTLPYDTLVELVEHLKACVEVASSRVGHWQTYCARDTQLVPFLIKACCLLDEGVAPTILQLLQCLVCDKESVQSARTPRSVASATSVPAATSAGPAAAASTLTILPVSAPSTTSLVPSTTPSSSSLSSSSLSSLSSSSLSSAGTALPVSSSTSLPSWIASSSNASFPIYIPPLPTSCSASFPDYNPSFTTTCSASFPMSVSFVYPSPGTLSFVTAAPSAISLGAHTVYSSSSLPLSPSTSRISIGNASLSSSSSTSLDSVPVTVIFQRHSTTSTTRSTAQGVCATSTVQSAPTAVSTTARMPPTTTQPSSGTFESATAEDQEGAAFRNVYPDVAARAWPVPTTYLRTSTSYSLQSSPRTQPTSGVTLSTITGSLSTSLLPPSNWAVPGPSTWTVPGPSTWAAPGSSLWPVPGTSAPTAPGQSTWTVPGPSVPGASGTFISRAPSSLSSRAPGSAISRAPGPSSSGAPGTSVPSSVGLSASGAPGPSTSGAAGPSTSVSPRLSASGTSGTPATGLPDPSTSVAPGPSTSAGAPGPSLSAAPDASGGADLGPSTSEEQQPSIVIESGPTTWMLPSSSSVELVEPFETESSVTGVTTGTEETEKIESVLSEASFQEDLCSVFVSSVFSQVSRDFLTRFVRTFLLETNATAVRWQTHALLLGIFKHSQEAECDILLEIMWSLWPQLSAFGRKAAQYVDLLGYFTLNTENLPRDLSEYVEEAVNLLQAQNRVLSCHPNSNLYSQVAQFVELDGFYLESEPCLVCNNPEVPYTSIKLSTIKIDSKFTTHTQIVKLIGSHTISRITLRISELKRTKMVRTINIYYNNRTVQAVVELKNKPAMWNKAKKVTLTSGQTESKIDFPLPIVACNLMIEYADFYENIQASTETLQCPRCSASVPANPGVCTNCGENVFQCHKCRAINYDEKDPFLCHACGFCKYAKFDYSLTARPCCAVDKIENDEDRKKTISVINTLLEKADRIYKTIMTNKPALELLLLKISEHRLDRTVEDGIQTGSSGSTQVNRAIQLLAQRYCGECKNSFEELSKIVQKVLACRRELLAYDQNDQVYSETGEASSVTDQEYELQQPCESEALPPLQLQEEELEVNIRGLPQPLISSCYGCASSATELCLTLLRALASKEESRLLLISEGLIAELLEYNLRRGTGQVQEEVRQLLCLLTRDNLQATEHLRQMLMDRISLALRGHRASVELTFAVRHEMNLLSTLVQKDDSCWEQKIRCVMQLFIIACEDSHSPVVMQSIILPCLKMLQSLIKPDQPLSKKNKDKTVDALANISPKEGINIVLEKYLQGDPKYYYAYWYMRKPEKIADLSSRNLSKNEWRKVYLAEKYFGRWHRKVFGEPEPLLLWEGSWLRNVLFNPCSRLARQVTCNMLESFCQVAVRKRKIIDLLTAYLRELSTAGESAAEYLSLYQSLIQPPPWKEYLALRGILVHIAGLLTQEIEELHHLEETTLTSNLSQGYALKMLTELLALFLEQDCIKQQYKGQLVSAVLNGYVSLRRLVIQRTRLIDETQEKLLEILEEITTGTEDETKEFMAICIDAVKKYSLHDMRTPVFIFERICSIIYPEDSDTGEFYLTLEKDPQQEDFLQGRMVGNPYASTEPGLGPLMRDVKNKICQDCELVALLEDDNGMELLVNNKIISLDLPVREVYKKVWVAEGGEGDAMRVVYRMRGLLGDATEEFVETLDAKSEQEVNDEDLYKMANVMADCGGLQIMLDRFAAIKETTKSKPLLQVLLKLFKLCLKVQRNQELLIDPELGTVPVLLRIVHLCLVNNCEKTITEQLLQITETILLKATSRPVEDFQRFSASFGGTLHVEALLPFTSVPPVTSNPPLLLHLTRILAALTYCNEERMALLCNHFKSVIDFNKFDSEHTPDDEQKLELFCTLTDGIERNDIGNTLKDYIISLGIVQKALDYIMVRAPTDKPILVRSDCELWKDFISKPSLKYILRFLTGLAGNHPATQLAVSAECVPIIHQLEQMSSDEHVGSLAENLLEALRQHPEVASRIEEVREYTRAEKKRLAMAMREKQLGALGMRSNEKGQVTSKSPHLMEDLGEETGLVCVICREGYKFQPKKVLGIYTFSKRCNVEEFEPKHRRSLGYTTVTHFNVVHVDCHMAAVRLARTRDEWDSAALQNANTRCNGLLPVWGPHVPESAFASCLARHNTYLQEGTGHRDITYRSTVHDLKLLLLRFAQEKSFHEDTGGGGPQSNMFLVPYLLHMALYIFTTTRSWAREEEEMISYLSNPHGWIKDCYIAEGPLYKCVMYLLLHSPARWKEDRFRHLNRLIVLAQARATQPSGPGPENRLLDLEVKDYSVYKPYVVFFGLVDGIYKYILKNLAVSYEKLWPSTLSTFLRHNDELLLKMSEKIFAFYTEDLLPCASFEEAFDVLELRASLDTEPLAHIQLVLSYGA
ncbi:protein purity of essence [Schistocerca piceifrons]|uniref:protein purity of essence n=1 Tax=Schistocerca piceifrons TaxID=274613 RepID=UPI001F5E9B79|nr:protein purity of essence [Schistocerca piceifrons]